MVLLALIWAVSTYSASHINGNMRRVVEVNDVLLSIVTQRAKMLDDEETGLRGYLLTGDRAFLQPYTQAHASLPALRSESVALGSRLPSTRPSLAHLEERAVAWERWSEGIIRSSPHNPRAPSAIRQQDEGKRLSDRYRTASAAVIEALDANRQANLRQSQQIEGWMNILSAAIVAGALLLTALVAWLTLRAVTLPLARLSRAAETIGGGDLSRTVEIDGAREFAGLARSMDQMRRQLVREAANRAQTEEVLQHHAARLSAIVDAQWAIAASGPNLPVVFDRATERTQQLTGATGAVIELADGEEMVYQAASGTAAPSLGLRLRRDASLSGLCAETGTILHCQDSEMDPRVDREACRRVGARSMIVVPLGTGSDVVGTLKVLSPEANAFRDHDVDTLQLMSGEIGAAMRTAAEFEAKQAVLVERMSVAEELGRANVELESFAYSVSHDLRAPLRSLDGFSQILLERYADKLDERGTRYLNHIRDAAQEMGQLIDAVLALSRVTRGEMRRDHVDLSALARSIVRDLQKNDPHRDVVVIVAEGIVATGDERLLRAVLQNLLGNAWKFTRQRSDACIEFGGADRDGIVTCFVRDNGAGFDMEYANKLFSPFQRLHGAGEFEGTGIGLATVQRIVQRHGGRAWAEGAVGQGATFSFTLQRPREGEPCRPVTT